MKKKLLAALLAAAMLTGLASATFAATTDSDSTKPGTGVTDSTKPGTDNPGTDNPGTDNPGTDNPGTDNPGTDNPGTDNPGTDNPGTDNPGTDNPGTDNPGTDNPGTTTPGGSNGGSSSDGSSSGGSSSGSSTTTTTTAGEAVSTTEATAKVEQAIAAADADATVVVVRIRNAKSITVAALKAVLKAAEKAEKAPIVHADVTKDGKVESRLYIDPSLVKGNGEIKLGVTLGDEKVTTKFDQYFKNDIAVVKFDQTGSFGMSIKAAVKLDLSKLDTKALVFYSYNPKTNTYTKMTAPNYRIDANGYLHFTTSMGNCVIVTDQPLARK